MRIHRALPRLPCSIAVLCLLGTLAPSRISAAEMSLSVQAPPGDSLLVSTLCPVAEDRLIVCGSRFIETVFDSEFVASWIPGGDLEWIVRAWAGDPIWISGVAPSAAQVRVGGIVLSAPRGVMPRFVLMELAPDGSLVRNVSVDAGLSVISFASLTALQDGATLVVLEGERPAGQPGIAVIRLSAAGNLEWARWLAADAMVRVHARVPLADGSALLMHTGRDTGYHVRLVILGADGSLVSSRTLRSVGRQAQAHDARLAANGDLVILGTAFPAGCPGPGDDNSAWIARLGAEDALDWVAWQGDEYALVLLGRELRTGEWEIPDYRGILTTASIDSGSVSAAEYRDAGATFSVHAAAERDGRLFAGGSVYTSSHRTGLLAELGAGGATSTACVTMAPLSRLPVAEALTLDPQPVSCTPMVATMSDDSVSLSALEGWAAPLCPRGPRPPRRVEDLRPNVPRGQAGLRPSW